MVETETRQMSRDDIAKVRSNHGNFCSMTGTWAIVIKLFSKGVLSLAQKERLVRKCNPKEKEEEQEANGKIFHY